MSDRDPKKMLHLRIDLATRDPLRVLAVHHHRSQANTVEWLILEEYRRLAQTGALPEHPPETTP